MPNEVSLVISTEGLMALAEMDLASRHQDRLEQLLEKNSKRELSDAEVRELDLLLKKVDELNLVKANASVALHRLKTGD